MIGGTKEGVQVTVGDVIVTWRDGYIPVKVDDLESFLKFKKFISR